uniref:GTSE1_N domain-containing protein n=1 Tax=Parastrongyloides trichosuri TaxID=131310 RepID=A0A0N4ZVI0_PARTI
MSGGDMYDRISLMSIDFSKAVRIPECIDDSTWLSLDNESEVDYIDLALQNEKYLKQQDTILNEELGIQGKNNDEVKFRLPDNNDIKTEISPYQNIKSPMKPSNTFINTTKIQPTIIDKSRGREKESKLPQSTNIRTRSVSRNALNRFTLKPAPPIIEKDLKITPPQKTSPKQSFFSKFTSYKSLYNNNSSTPPKGKSTHKKSNEIDKAKIEEINITAKKQEMLLMEELCKARERIAMAQHNDSRPTSSASNSNNNVNSHMKSMEQINIIDREQNNNLFDDCNTPRNGPSSVRSSRLPTKTGIPVSSKLSLVKTPFRAISSFRCRENSTTPLSSRDNSFTGVNSNPSLQGKTNSREYVCQSGGGNPLHRSTCSSSSSSITKASSNSPMSQSGYALSTATNNGSIITKGQQQLSIDERWIDECF